LERGRGASVRFVAQSIQTRHKAASAEAKASLRGMQIGVRYTRLANTPADLQKATAHAERRTAVYVDLKKQIAERK
jgi:hypothetical protein